MLVVLGLYAVLAVSFVVGKASLEYIQPLLLTAIRLILAGFIMLGYIRLYEPNKWRFEKDARWIFLGVILFHGYLSYVFYFLALDGMSSAKTALLYNLAPFFSAFFAYFCASQVMTKRKWLGLIIGFLGTLPTIVVHNGPDIFGYFSWPEIFIVTSVASSSFGWCLVYLLTNSRSYSPLMINGTGMLGGGILALFTSILLEGGIFARLANFGQLLHVAPGSTVPTVIWPILYISAGLLSANIIFYNVYSLLLRRYSLVYLSFSGFITPLFVAFLGWFFLAEPIPHYFGISFTILSIGLYIFYQEEL